MSLREWTGWRVAAAWVLWLVLACGGAIAAAIVYARAHEPLMPSVTGPASGPVIGPSYSSITLDGWLVLTVLVGPLALLTATWLWQRRRRRRAAS